MRKPRSAQLIRSEKTDTMEASSDLSTSRNDFRRSVEREQVLQALWQTIGVIYPTTYCGKIVELLCCGNCPRHFTRDIGSSVKFCGICIAAMKT